MTNVALVEAVHQAIRLHTELKTHKTIAEALGMTRQAWLYVRQNGADPDRVDRWLTALEARGHPRIEFLVGRGFARAWCGSRVPIEVPPGGPPVGSF